MKLVIVTPAGRERYMRLLSHYILAAPEVSEWHIWDNCRTEADRAYLERLAATDPRCQIKRVPGETGGWGLIGEFFRFCDDPEALYLRFDDDIVYIEPDFFPRFIARALEERGKAFWFSPLIINNALCSFMLKHLAKVQITGPVSAQCMCPYSWAYPNFPAAMHPVFIDAVRLNRISDFRTPDREVRLSRFSINALGFFGEDRVRLGEEFIAPNGAEEEWISSILPMKENRHGKIFGDLIVSHFAFYTQEWALLRGNSLEGYYEIAGLPPFAYEKPPLPKKKRKKLKDVLRPWKVRPPPYPGPDYQVALSDAEPLTAEAFNPNYGTGT